MEYRLAKKNSDNGKYYIFQKFTGSARVENVNNTQEQWCRLAEWNQRSFFFTFVCAAGITSTNNFHFDYPFTCSHHYPCLACTNGVREKSEQKKPYYDVMIITENCFFTLIYSWVIFFGLLIAQVRANENTIRWKCWWEVNNFILPLIRAATGSGIGYKEYGEEKRNGKRMA